MDASGILAKKKMLDTTKSAWQKAASKEINQILYATNDQRDAVVSKVEDYRDALLDASTVISEKRDAVGDDPAKKLAYELELGKLLNRTNHFLNLFGAVLVKYNVRLNSIKKPFPFENNERSTDQALADTLLFSHIVHFSAMCDLHEHHMPLDDARFAPLAPVAPVAAPAPAPAPARVQARTGAAVAPAAPAAAAAPRPAAKARGKSPARPRAGAVASTGAAPTASSPAPVPAAAAGMSTTPLVPAQTATGELAAPRRRAREAAAGGESSVTNSLFENMFKPAAATDASVDEPASPTPSSGSEGQATGPRIFRRQR